MFFATMDKAGHEVNQRRATLLTVGRMADGNGWLQAARHGQEDGTGLLG